MEVLRDSVYVKRKMVDSMTMWGTKMRSHTKELVNQAGDLEHWPESNMKRGVAHSVVV